MASRAKLNVVTPGEEPAASDGAEQPADAAPAAPAATELLDQSEIDTDAIPYGKTVLSKQGHVCSTAPDPKQK